MGFLLAAATNATVVERSGEQQLCFGEHNGVNLEIVLWEPLGKLCKSLDNLFYEKGRWLPLPDLAHTHTHTPTHTLSLSATPQHTRVTLYLLPGKLTHPACISSMTSVATTYKHCASSDDDFQLEKALKRPYHWHWHVFFLYDPRMCTEGPFTQGTTRTDTWENAKPQRGKTIHLLFASFLF